MDKNLVLDVCHFPFEVLQNLFSRYQLNLILNPADKEIPGSYWGESEAGLIGNTLHIRADTPIHSLFHEACHYICMSEQRRKSLHTDAAGDYDEENAVCFLQILLAEKLPNFGHKRMMQDMDSWGYTFRLGSAQKWFDEDAEDALNWLQQHRIVDDNKKPTYKLRVL